MSEDIKELVGRLRTFRHRDANAAADALEAMAGEVETLKHDIARHMTIANEAAAERDRLKAALGAIAVKAGTSECGGNYVAAVSLIGDLEQMADAALRAAAGSALEAKP